MKKLFVMFVSLLMIFAVLPTTVFSEENDSIVVLGESDPIDVNENYVYEFIDPNLANNNGDIVPYGLIIPEYSHSYYTYSSHSIIGYDVGPREKDKFLFSLAGGQSLDVSRTISETASLGFQASVTVGEKDVICGYLGFNASGSATVTYRIDETITAPDDYDTYSYIFCCELWYV